MYLLCGLKNIHIPNSQNRNRVCKSCLQDTNCCLTSQPCQNGGSCVLDDPTTSTNSTRCRCKCRRGYQGLYCEKPIRSCRGYKTKQKSGIYYVIDADGDTFQVLCKFSSKRIWTLIQSYQPGNRGYLQEDRPVVNETNPNYFLYRLSFSKMESIRRNSSAWSIERGKKDIDEWWDMTYFNIDVHKKICTSCVTYKYAKENSSKPEIKRYNQHDCKYDECKNIDNYGLFCCYNSSCSSKQLVTKIWLGDAKQ